MSIILSKPVRWKVAQHAELRWWKNYLQSRPPEKYLAWKKNYWLKFLDTLPESLRHLNGKEVLDAGCGPAGIFMVLDQCRVDAVDPLLDAYATALPHFRTEWYSYTRFHSASLEDYTSQNKYDITFCLNAINHVANIDKALDRMIASLKEGGRLVMSIDAHNYRLLKAIFRLIPGDILHPHQYDIREYEQMLEKRGLRIQNRILAKKESIFSYYVLVAG
jgi:2-polyprenyl-3-methyl-5-hydroxy-6-metoxy-1,4-benzoquinol methylase